MLTFSVIDTNIINVGLSCANADVRCEHSLTRFHFTFFSICDPTRRHIAQ